METLSETITCQIEFLGRAFRNTIQTLVRILSLRKDTLKMDELIHYILYLTAQHNDGTAYSLWASVLKHYLADLYSEIDRFAEAESLYLEAIENLSQKLDSQHPNILSIVGSLAVLYAKTNQLLKSEHLHVQVIKGLYPSTGLHAPIIQNYIRNLVSLYEMQGKKRKARALSQNPERYILALEQK